MFVGRHYRPQPDAWLDCNMRNYDDTFVGNYEIEGLPDLELTSASWNQDIRGTFLKTQKHSLSHQKSTFPLTKF